MDLAWPGVEGILLPTSYLEDEEWSSGLAMGKPALYSLFMWWFIASTMAGNGSNRRKAVVDWSSP